MSQLLWGTEFNSAEIQPGSSHGINTNLALGNLKIMLIKCEIWLWYFLPVVKRRYFSLAKIGFMGFMEWILKLHHNFVLITSLMNTRFLNCCMCVGTKWNVSISQGSRVKKQNKKTKSHWAIWLIKWNILRPKTFWFSKYYHHSKTRFQKWFTSLSA